MYNFESTKSPKDFIENELNPYLSDLEKRRLKWLFCAILLTLITFFVCTIFALNIKLDGKNLGPILFVAILPYLLITEKYNLDIQKRVMNKFLSFFGKFEYSDNECIPDYKIVKSKLFDCNKNDSKSCFSGLIKNCKNLCAITKLYLEDKESLKKELVFDGLISMSLIENFFDKNIIIATNADFSSFSELPRVPDTSLFAFCEDSTYAHKILTPEFENWFNSLTKTFNSEKIAVSLFENTILTSVYYSNLKCFEFKSIYNKIKFNEKMNELYNHLTKLFEVNFLDFPRTEHFDKHTSNE